MIYSVTMTKYMYVDKHIVSIVSEITEGLKKHEF
jgi:hypothetical protein